MNSRFRHSDLHQEEDDVPRSKVVVGLVVILVVSAVLIVWTVDLVNGRSSALRPSGVFPERWLGPRHLVSRVREDLFTERRPGATINAEKRRELGSYGWVDPGQGIVRIPIEEAMSLVARGEKP